MLCMQASGPSPEAKDSQLSETEMYGIVARMCRFTMHQIVNEKGVFFDRDGDIAKHQSLRQWEGQLRLLQQIVLKNAQNEKDKQDAQSTSWPSNKKDESK